ncbi:MAG: relaxase/mobilization nuclease domain-containing protein [Alphaproteobacteria bacterium]|nr:relaxase/mobilization nuclease domain-containing protein [Alphaproteobacteria bacterium]
MIIKSTIRGGYLSAAQYMKDIGENEKTRLVELSDPEAKNLDDAFQKMWEVACPTKVKKPLHHISINPMKGEHLTDKQVLAIADRCEELYGYKMFHHQRVIVEHIKDGRQHFHVIWNRVSLVTGKTVWPGHHWKKSKQVAREMEERLGLKRPQPRGKAIKKTTSSKTRAVKPRSSGLRLSSPDRKPPQTKSKSLLPTASHRPAQKKSEPPPPMQPMHPKKKRWPDQAIIDWEVWGHLWPKRFFALWPELIP